MKRRHFLGYSLLFIAGCTATSSQPNDRGSQSTVNPPEMLRFAVTDTKGLDELQQDYEAFRTAMEEVLATKIEFFPVENYFAAAVALQADRVDLVWAGPSEYVVIRARTNATPILALHRPNFQSVMAVRADSGIQSVAELKGKTIEMGTIGSTASYLGGIKILLDAGLNPQSDCHIISSDDNSLQSLKNGEVDAWLRGFNRYHKALKFEDLLESEYPSIAKGNPLPSDVFIASSYLESEWVGTIIHQIMNHQDQLIKAILSSKNLYSRFQDSKLELSKDSDYDMIREVYQAIGQGDFLQ